MTSPVIPPKFFFEINMTIKQQIIPTIKICNPIKLVFEIKTINTTVMIVAIAIFFFDFMFFVNNELYPSQADSQ
jgi:hypothetical protein